MSRASLPRTALVAALLFSLIGFPMLAATSGADALVGGITKHAAEQLIGITPALANTPFLGLATLCGLALVADSAWARESESSIAVSIRQNALIGRMRPYSSVWLFSFLIVVALLVYAANSGKLQGIIGKLVHVVEAVTVFGTYILLSTTVLRDLPKPPSQPVAQMGVIPATTAVLLGVTAILALGTMMMVRFAIGVAIWLIPIPLVDVAFETAKKFITLFMIVLYLVSPFLATMFAVGLILLSALVVRWAWRLLAFIAWIIVLPRLGIHRMSSRNGLAVRACALDVRGFRRRESATLVIKGGKIEVLHHAPARTPSSTFESSTHQLALVRGLWWSELREFDANGAVVNRIAFATTAFDAVGRAAAPVGIAIDQSKLSGLLAPSPLRRA